MNEIEFTDFTLSYNGMYLIEWLGFSRRVYLELNTILKMLQVEGLSLHDVHEIIKNGNPIHFKKVTMVYYGTRKEDGRMLLQISDKSGEYVEYEMGMYKIDLKED
jgi:hypothetical protein